jgi:CDP-2,3-bis-(O-geranylgeranyl)-sn-glycerol synthase
MVSQLVILLLVANGTPALLGLMPGARGHCPLDGHIRLWDGQPLFGPSKTAHGLFSALLVTGLVAPLFQLSIATGVAFATLAMLGDLSSSFIKRRLGHPSGKSVPLLDQLPESVVPLWGLQTVLGAGWLDMIAAVIVFVVVDLLLSGLLRSVRV